MSYKKTIIHLINSKIYSGLESVACDIINNLNDYNHIYVTQNGPIIDILKEKNIKYEIISKMSITELRRVIRKYNADIIHAHDFIASCISAMSLTRKTIISHLHHNAPWLRKINFKTLLYLICSFRFKKIFTVSEAIEKEFIFSKIIKNKIVMVGNPISKEKVLLGINQKCKKEYDICITARLSEPKNPFRFIRLIDRLKINNKNISAVMIGDGELKEDCIALIKKLNLENNIKLCGFLKNPYQEMVKSKVFCLTSNWEGYGLVAFEALTLGLPAVVSNVGGLSSIVDESCGKLCNSDEDFYNEIEMLLNKQEYYDRKKINAYKKSSKIENFDVYMKKIDEIYTKA